MLLVYGSYMPIRILEEIRFWKMQEKEHTVVIRQIVPNLELPYAAMLQAWEPVFARTEQMADQLIQKALPHPAALPPGFQAQTDALLQAAAKQSRTFAEQLTALLTVSPAVAGSPIGVTVVKHIIRESEYFLNALATLLEPRPQEHENENDAASVDAQQSDETEEAGFRRGIAEEDEGSSRSDDSGRAPVQSVPIGGHTLPPLPYSYDALEPYIDTMTMRIHHDKHHQSYVDGLNKAEKELEKARKTGNFDLVKHWERELAFNGAGHYLHTLFWNVMSPKGGGAAVGPLAQQIQKDFGSYEAFKKQFSQAAEKVEGGGWAILVWSPRSRRLEILTAEKHQNLSQWDVVPILPLDVWEHAYYLKHQNKRPEYITNWWNVVNWPYANERFQEASKLVWAPY
ncbi:Fe-Mn family superoxide dismutase [Paenibacillus spongiae]|uniref:superoxide dismutase n=1 Tax=Paenibacillus spongiae TaxID=2909671 RepID=A0ABY5SAC4_9BACL|nr:Fe-Mn family superoxide dismutase [Paenibacillus spongiae]UVI30892.1 DUF2935 domain-containing protein [Paenibacillus spongiae]